MVVFCLLAGTGMAAAHPHVFVVAKVNLTFSNGQLDSLKTEWQFDEMTTMAIFGAGSMGESLMVENSKYSTIWGQAVPDPAVLNDFCFVELDGSSVKLPKPEEVGLSVVNGQLVYSFLFRIDRPMDKMGKVWFYDQSNYIAYDMGAGVHGLSQSTGTNPSLQIQTDNYVEKIILGR